LLRQTFVLDQDRIHGVLLGTAIGGAIGLPHEGLHPARIARRLRRAPLSHAMWCGRGLLSDDTEHTAMVARALASSGGDVPAFRTSLGRQLGRWLLSLPPGIGFATLRGAARLLFGWSPERSGVHSAGNGPAMRSALLGLCATDDAHLVALVHASTRMTHTDARAEDGARLVARMARDLARGIHDEGIVNDVRDHTFRDALRHAWHSSGTLEDYRAAAGFEHGVSGFVVHTVPAAVHCVRACAHPSLAIERAVRLGGDTDTVAAIVGALVGARHGASALPAGWVAGVRDWPLSVDVLRQLGDALVRTKRPFRPTRAL
jgi:ADP-ribosylglycohydrolase